VDTGVGSFLCLQGFEGNLRPPSIYTEDRTPPAEEQNFTRAAEREHVAQSGISQQVRRLERELGETLFDRLAHRVVLTDAGSALLPHARSALQAAEAAREAVAERRSPIRGRLAVGTVRALPVEINLPALLARYHREHPRVEVTLREEQTDTLVDELKQVGLHVAFIGFPTPQVPDGLAAELLSVEPLVLVTSRDHPIAGSDHASLKLLRDEPFVTLTHGSGLRRLLENSCARAGFRPRVAFETSDVSLLTDLAARGLGVAIVPRSIAIEGTTRNDLTMTNITRPTLRRHVVLAYRRGGPQSPAAQAFLEVARGVLLWS
jgi:DNA-binding transcriptional LysR family regulator